MDASNSRSPSPKRKRPAADDANIRRPIRSCLQCRARKVRCDQGRPCRNCLRRREPELCQYTGSDLDGHQSVLLQQADQAFTRPKTDGNLHMVHEKVIRPALEDVDDGCSLAGRDLRAALDDASHQSHLDIMPRDIMNLYESFLLRAHQFVPIVLSLPDLAEAVRRYAEPAAAPAGDSTPGLPARIAPSQKALLFAVLASGAQYSDFTRPRRDELTRSFIYASFDCLRSANFLSRPSSETIQSLLLIGHCLQNSFQCNAAWSLLGLTIRLSNSIGIHQSMAKDHLPDSLAWKAQLLDSIGWQDALLSICTGNVPSVVVERGTALPEDSLNYPEAMRFLCARCAQLLLHRRTYGEPLRDVIDQVVQIRDTFRRLSLKLNLAHSGEHSTQHLQRVAFRVHTSYTVSYLCRPALASIENSPNDAAIRSKLLEICISALTEALNDYVTLLRLTIIAVRSWSLLHNGLGASLMLGVLGEIKRNQHVRSLVREILRSLNEADMHGIAAGNEWDKKIAGKLQALYDEGNDQSSAQLNDAAKKKTAAHWAPARQPEAQGVDQQPANPGQKSFVPQVQFTGEGIDVTDLEGFESVFTQDWLADWNQNLF